MFVYNLIRRTHLEIKSIKEVSMPKTKTPTTEKTGGGNKPSQALKMPPITQRYKFHTEVQEVNDSGELVGGSMCTHTIGSFTEYSEHLHRILVLKMTRMNNEPVMFPCGGDNCGKCPMCLHTK